MTDEAKTPTKHLYLYLFLSGGVEHSNSSIKSFVSFPAYQPRRTVKGARRNLPEADQALDCYGVMADKS